jgi:pimeloyl-ACP methyl ester carboxylesterase
MPIITLPSGTHIWYEQRGAGPALLHIHGSAFGHKNFERLTPKMTPSFDVIDFDLPGFGESSASARGSGIEAMAEDVADLIPALGYERLHVHGTSFGGLVALTLAATHPELIDRLVLSCFLTRYDLAARVMRRTWKRAALESGMDAVADLTAVAGFSRSYYERPEATAQLERMRAAFLRNDPQAFVKATESVEAADLTSLPDKVTAPTLLLAGAEDNMTPVDCAPSGTGFRQLKDALSDAQLIVLSDCGHYLVIEQAEQAADHITQFLTR